ncbi:MAG: rRNA maturation RNase YbeY [Acidobacteriaceae bacterium]|nr:rRNA maturation RNase YbeY [Acidobacteriaceae bacterium]
MSPDGSTVLFGALPNQSKLTLTEKRRLKSFAQVLSQEVANGRAFTCLITTDDELRSLNSQFLRHDYATDVLSFPSDAAEGELGDLAISVNRAEVQAREFGHTRTDEICMLMLHGVLHLTGMDHEADNGEMARAEGKWRDQFGLPTSLISRSTLTRSAP